MRAVTRRLAAIERQIKISEERTGMTLFLDWYDTPVTGARCGGQAWESEDGETLAAFQIRLEREAPHPESRGFRLVQMTGVEGGFSEAGVL
jgi:hypothetical protein